MTCIVQYTKAFVAEYVAGAQLNYISFLIALCGLCILFLYYIISSENESNRQHIDHRMEQSDQRMDRRMEQNDRRMDLKFFQMEQNILSVIRGNVPGNGGNNFVQPFSKSPIDIQRGYTAYEGTLPNTKLRFNYGNFSTWLLNVYGSGLSVIWPNWSSINFPYLLYNDKKLRLEKLTVHFGTDSRNGSLHKVNGEGYAGELNFLHRNAVFNDFSDALRSPDLQGTLFIAVFLQESEQDNEVLSPLIDVLSQVTYADTECLLSQTFDASRLLPLQNNDFWIYFGSEPVNPFRETVKWLVCRTPITISSKQLSQLRKLKKNRRGDQDESLISNSPLQMLLNRTIQSSFVWN
uniref:Alpha-carbonic anhydrase domain-containing protein n=2 Tax=Meloidogyne TaxID=189290 RepID=A0A6V7TS07_MELEN|nr:unnamed protein product [Meloidogyne enterolobii]